MSAVLLPMTRTPSTWLWLGVPGALALLVYAPLVPGLIREWATYPNLSHGFAIPLIAAYLIWARRERLGATPLAPSLWGLPALLVGLFALVAGVRGDESFIARISLPVTLIGIALFVGGWKLTRELSFGIVYLVFMIPLPWATLKLITYRSRMLDAGAATTMLGWIGVPVHQEGVLLHLPNTVLEVADECSSIPAIAALLSLGVAYASVVSRPLLARILLVVMALPFAILSNIIRITTTAAGVYYVGTWTLDTVYHQFNGTMNFLITFALLLLLDVGLVRVLGEERR